MDTEQDKIYARLAGLDKEVSNLREGYVIVNSRYRGALTLLVRLSAE